MDSKARVPELGRHRTTATRGHRGSPPPAASTLVLCPHVHMRWTCGVPREVALRCLRQCGSLPSRLQSELPRPASVDLAALSLL